MKRSALAASLTACLGLGFVAPLVMAQSPAVMVNKPASDVNAGSNPTST